MIDTEKYQPAPQNMKKHGTQQIWLFHVTPAVKLP
jgi:hypothetical protein